MITINHDNIESEHLCCIIKKKIKDTGVELKREYIQERLDYYRFVKEDVDGRAFIEYVPLEYALVPVTGNFIYIHCLWVDNPFKHQGYGKELLNECIRFLYKGIIIKHNKTEPTYTKTSLFLCEKRRFFMGRTEKGGKVF